MLVEAGDTTEIVERLFCAQHGKELEDFNPRRWTLCRSLSTHSVQLTRLASGSARGDQQRCQAGRNHQPSATTGGSVGERQPPSMSWPCAIGRNRLPSVIGEREACAR